MVSEKNVNSKTVEELFEKGKTLYEAGKYEDAIKYFDKVLEIDQEHANACLFKGFALGKLGKLEEAEECFILVYNTLYSGISKYEGVIEYYDTVLEIYNSFLENIGALTIEGFPIDKIKEIMDELAEHAYYDKGLALSNLGKYEEAIECFNKVLEIKQHMMIDNRMKIISRDLSHLTSIIEDIKRDIKEIKTELKEIRNK